MPTKPKRPCRFPGCAELTHDRYCVKHNKQIEASYDKYQRDPESVKRYGQAWRKIRKRFLNEHPLCEICQREGKLTPAEQVHHRKPLADGGTNDTSNLMSLCAACHSTITAKEGGRWGKRYHHYET
jgi:5-methylcytosine-specific restriction enzyme A